MEEYLAKTCLVREATEWGLEGTRLQLDCRTAEGPAVRILVRALAEDVVRVHMLPGAVAGPRLPSLLLDPEWKEPQVIVEESDGAIHFKTGSVTLRINLSPWRLSLFDASGALLMSDNHTDLHNSLAVQTPPLGFKVDEEGVCRGVQAGFRLFPEEQLYGLGEKFNDLGRRGQRADTRNVDIGTATTQRAYKNIPFIMSTRGYGLIVDTGFNTEWDLGASSSGGFSMRSEDPEFDLYLLYGPQLSRVLELLTDLTGKPFKPPRWFYGLWMSRFTYSAQFEVEEICRLLREHRIPCDVIHLDPGWLRDNHHCDFIWDRERFPDPQKMIEDMRRGGFRLDLWICAWIPVDTPIFIEMREKGYLVKGPDGVPFTFSNAPNVEITRNRGMIFPDWRPGPRHARPDFTHPELLAWLKREHIGPLVRMGVDSFLTDQSEYVEDVERFANGLTGKQMHNHYTNLFNQVFFEAFREFAPEREGVVVARAGYIGNQARTVSMLGDQLSEFPSLPHVIQASLAASLCGISISGCDIGGISGRRMPTPELYVRWAQFGLLSAYARCHGTSPREPWAYGEEALRIFRRLTEFRYRLIPYLYSYGVIAHRTGLPVMRPMVLEFQNDPATHSLGLQYMLGRELLVAPIYDETSTRDIYFPEGRWIHYWDKREVRGPVHMRWKAPLDSIPLFVRAGSILPLGPVMQHTGEKPLDPLTVEVYPGGTASFTLHDGEDAWDLLAADAEDGSLTLSISGTRQVPTCEILIHQARQPHAVEVAGRRVGHAKDAAESATTTEAWTYDQQGTVLKIRVACAPRVDLRIR